MLAFAPLLSRSGRENTVDTAPRPEEAMIPQFLIGVMIFLFPSLMGALTIQSTDGIGSTTIDTTVVAGVHPEARLL